MASQTVSLRVLSAEGVVFESRGSWLHPLFELEAYLNTRDIDVSALTLSDKIIGKAAALLIQRLGFKEVHAGIISKPGCQVFDEAGIRYTYDTCVDLIECATERLLSQITDPDEAHKIISDRIATNT